MLVWGREWGLGDSEKESMKGVLINSFVFNQSLFTIRCFLSLLKKRGITKLVVKTYPNDAFFIDSFFTCFPFEAHDFQVRYALHLDTTALRQLVCSLEENQLTFFRCRRVESFTLRGNPEYPDPTTLLCSLKEDYLFHLDLEDVWFSDYEKFLKLLQRMIRLTSLRLAANQSMNFTRLFQTLRHVENLSTLHIENNVLERDTLEALKKYVPKTLTTLILRKTAVGYALWGNIPLVFPCLKAISLTDNNISGNVEYEIFRNAIKDRRIQVDLRNNFLKPHAMLLHHT